MHFIPIKISEELIFVTILAALVSYGLMETVRLSFDEFNRAHNRKEQWWAHILYKGFSIIGAVFVSIVLAPKHDWDYYFCGFIAGTFNVFIVMLVKQFLRSKLQNVEATAKEVIDK